MVAERKLSAAESEEEVKINGGAAWFQDTYGALAFWVFDLRRFTLPFLPIG